MVEIFFDDRFERVFSKIRDRSLRAKLLKQLQKLRRNPEAGKPMRFWRKGTRELYVKPYRLARARAVCV